jgi:hypothetical protein
LNGCPHQKRIEDYAFISADDPVISNLSPCSSRATTRNACAIFTLVRRKIEEFIRLFSYK